MAQGSSTFSYLVGCTKSHEAVLIDPVTWLGVCWWVWKRFSWKGQQWTSGCVCVCVLSKLKPWNEEHPTSPCTRVSEPKRILRRLGMWWLTDIDRERDRFDLKCHPFCVGSGFNPLPCKHGRLKIIPLKKSWRSTVIVLKILTEIWLTENSNLTIGKLSPWRTVGSACRA